MLIIDRIDNGSRWSGPCNGCSKSYLKIARNCGRRPWRKLIFHCCRILPLSKVMNNIGNCQNTNKFSQLMHIVARLTLKWPKSISFIIFLERKTHQLIFIYMKIMKELGFLFLICFIGIIYGMDSNSRDRSGRLFPVFQIIRYAAGLYIYDRVRNKKNNFEITSFLN